MNENEMEPKSPAGAAVALAIVGLIFGLVGGCIGGVIGGGVGIIPGIAAILLGTKAKKITDRRKGGAGFGLGIATSIISFLMLIFFLSAPSAVRTMASDNNLTTLYENADRFYFGVAGFSSMSEDNLKKMNDELDAYNASH